MKIVFTGGGSGGHILPIISIIRELKKIAPTIEKKGLTGKKNEEIEYAYVGPKDKMNILLKQEGIEVKNILTGKIRRYFSFGAFVQNVIDLAIFMPLGIIQSLFMLYFDFPNAKLIFSKGGYGAFPFTIASWLMGFPIFMHESDSEPGLTNRRLAEVSKIIFTSFPDQQNKFPAKNAVLTGNPVRREILGFERQAARDMLGIAGEKPVIFLLGGSQGSRRLNNFILNNLPEFLKKYEIIHQCGASNFDQVVAEAKIMTSQALKPFYHLFGFMNDEEYGRALGACDLVISRGGAGSIFEIAAAGKPSILVPLPEAAQNHQIKNAYAYAQTGAALVIEESNFTPHFLMQKIDDLIANKKLDSMAKNALAFSKPQAAAQIAAYIRDYLAAI